MPLWLQVVLTLAVLIGVVPLFVLANTGKFSAAWEASKEYLVCVAILVVPAALFNLVLWLIIRP